MTNSLNNGTLEPTTTDNMAKRPRIVIDVKNPKLNQEIRIIAVTKGISMKELVLKATAKEYPGLKSLVDEELA